MLLHSAVSAFCWRIIAAECCGVTFHIITNPYSSASFCTPKLATSHAKPRQTSGALKTPSSQLAAVTAHSQKLPLAAVEPCCARRRTRSCVRAARSRGRLTGTVRTARKTFCVVAASCAQPGQAARCSRSQVSSAGLKTFDDGFEAGVGGHVRESFRSCDTFGHRGFQGGEAAVERATSRWRSGWPSRRQFPRGQVLR